MVSFQASAVLCTCVVCRGSLIIHFIQKSTNFGETLESHLDSGSTGI